MDKSVYRRVAVVAAAGVAALGLAACGTAGSGGSGKTAGAANKGSYQLGGSLSLTGGFGPVATSWDSGISAYYDAVNAAGGINGHKVTLTVLDDAANAASGVSNTRQLINNDHVSAEFVYFSNIAVAAAPLLNSSSTPAIVEAPTVGLLRPVEAEIYGGATVISQEPYVQIPFAEKLLKHVAHAKVAIITATSAVLSAYVQTASSTVKKAGWTVSSVQEVPTNATSAAAEAQVVASSHPNVILMALPGPLEISAVSTLRQAGLNVPILSYFAGSAESTLQQLDDPNLYSDAAASYANTATGATVKAAVAAAKTNGANTATIEYMNGYLDASVVGKALKACGYPCSSAQMTKAMNKLGTFSTDGLAFANWTYTAKNHQGLDSVGIVHWDPASNKPVVVASVALPVLGG